MQRTHYQRLAVPPDASKEEIDRAFKLLARRVHPDLHGGDGAAEERMKELNESRAVLTDPAARAAYDEQLARERAAARAASAAARPAPPPPWRPDRGAAWMDATAATFRADVRPRHASTPAAAAAAAETTPQSGRPFGWDLPRIVWTVAAVAAPLLVFAAVGIVLKVIVARR